ncbi:hypothetical protein J2T60_001872 [Natronospira proteinivora]|uniref:Sulfotransferase family protein n=1 Tax=Natronospira proteinivora TaxID=1807133 RepID=A0ABT1G9Z5_9GAMM|nr:hypothetical protein [Natronospira proteinivora]MCP1727872.1 hypothetical protein [Natronospira proteinivora]
MKGLLLHFLNVPPIASLIGHVSAVALSLGLIGEGRVAGLLRRLDGRASDRAMVALLAVAVDRQPQRQDWLDGLVAHGLRAGHPQRVWKAFQANESRMGFSPASRLRLLLRLQWHEETACLLEALAEFRDRLAAKFWRFMPSILEADMPEPDDLIELARQGEQRRLDIALGRVAFDFREFSLSGALLERGLGAGQGNAVDRLAMHYAQSRAGVAPETGPALESDLASARGYRADPQYALLACELAIHQGDAEGAAARLDEWLRSADLPVDDSDTVQTLSHGMLKQILACRMGDGPSVSLEASRPVCVHKVFVCGNGWSGSGAMHNALQEYDTVVEFPQAAPEALANKGSFSEVSLFQGAAGLGGLWRKLDKGTLPHWRDLWDLFRCHVLGGAWVGYPEYKCAVMARAMQSAFGLAHWYMFSETLPALCSAVASEDVEGARYALTCLAERACLEAVRHAGGEPDQSVLVLNNAVFARNVDILPLFHQARAVCVHRDPRDVWADRMLDDDRHWRTVQEFADFYAGNERRTRQRIAGLADQGRVPVRQVAFEGLVRDGRLREELCQWALTPVGGQRVREILDPARSQQNIGIHEARLDEQALQRLAPLVAGK